jgi:GTP-binding protein
LLDVHTLREVSRIRNVAIIAHVDHGKTTIVDQLLRCAAASSYSSPSSSTAGSQEEVEVTAQHQQQQQLVMDSGELERERGITITSKVTRLDYYQQHSMSTADCYTINVVDTPGHADFAGEVDRILSMIDGVCLVVDAAEGAMAQTKYVLSRALALHLKPIVVLNKCDKDNAWSRIETGEVETEILDLFDALGATESQMDYVTIYASGKAGWCTTDIDVARQLATKTSEAEVAPVVVEKKGINDISMRNLLNTVIDYIPPPTSEALIHQQSELPTDNPPFAMAATTVGYDPFLGRLCTGRILSGIIQKNESVTVIPRSTLYPTNTTSSTSQAQPTTASSTSTITGVFVNRGVNRTPLIPPVASVGDIVTLSGVPDSITVGDTLTSTSNPIPQAIDTPPLTPPTLSMEFGANTSPLSGQEGTLISSAKIRERLLSETDNNVTLTVATSESDPEKTVVNARGELQLGILIEQMRREGFELSVLPPNIIMTICPTTGRKMEPYEEVTVDTDSEYAGTVVNALTGSRKGVLLNMSDSSDGKTRLFFEVPSRGLLGFSSEIASATRGNAVVNHLFLENRVSSGSILRQEKGRLVCNASGKASLYALANVAERGDLFVAPGDLVYPGMVIGEYSRSGDLEVNAVKAKEVSNMRTTAKDEKLYIPPPKRMSVEELISYMNDDEQIEVTPRSVRLRKAELDSGVRQRLARNRKKQVESMKR